MMDDMGLDDGHHKFGMPGSDDDDSSDSMSGTLMRQTKKIPTVLKALPKKGPKSRKKNPDAPKRFKSSFIFFSMAKHKQIKEHLANQGEAARTTNITKMVSDAWRNMGPEEREVYDDLAREDKTRYEKEKANYQGPLGGAGSKKVKDPNAPKRPMSAFLAFANSRRGEVKGKNSECSNGEISKLLSVMWKEADEDIKKGYRENESALWAAYKVSIAEYRKKNDGRKKAKAAAEFDDDEDSPVPVKKRKKKKVKQSKHDDEDIPPVSGEEFEDHHLSGGGFDTLGNPNQDEMMAASALRGVRGGPNSYSFGGSSGNDLQKQLQQQQDQLDRLQQQQQQQLEQAQMNNSSYGSLFGMSGMNPYAALSGGGGNGTNGLSGGLPSGLGVGGLSGSLGGSGLSGGLGGSGLSGGLGGSGLSGGLGGSGLSGGLGGSGLSGGLGGSGLSGGLTGGLGVGALSGGALSGGLGVGGLSGGLGGSGLSGGLGVGGLSGGLGGSGLGGGLGGSGLGGGGLSQDNSRALLEMGIPYGLQNYGGLGGNGLGGGGLGGSGLAGLGGAGLSGGGLGGGGLGVGGLGGGGLGGSLGDSQAMLMAQALHGNPNPYNSHMLGLGGGQQQSLSQLASLAGQRGGGGGSQGYQGIGGGGMGNLLNDNSTGSGMGRLGEHQGRY